MQHFFFFISNLQTYYHFKLDFEKVIPPENQRMRHQNVFPRVFVEEFKSNNAYQS